MRAQQGSELSSDISAMANICFVLHILFNISPSISNKVSEAYECTGGGACKSTGMFLGIYLTKEPFWRLLFYYQSLWMSLDVFRAQYF